MNANIELLSRLFEQFANDYKRHHILSPEFDEWIATVYKGQVVRSDYNRIVRIEFPNHHYRTLFVIRYSEYCQLDENGHIPFGRQPLPAV